MEVLLRDKCHATRRLVSRPWAADPNLARVLSTYVTGKTSIVHLIQNSPDINTMFERHVESITNCPIAGARIKNLRYAKQRYDSTSKPLGRFILFFDAVWATALDVVASRANRESAKRARAFLASVTCEDVLQIALLADVGHECCALTRLFDTEAYDVATISDSVDDLVHKLDVLLLQRAATGALNSNEYCMGCCKLSSMTCVGVCLT